MNEPFVTFREQTQNGLGYFICQRDHPHYVGQITEFPIKNLVEASAVSSYNLWISFGGSLRGEMIPSYANVDKEIVDAMQEMAEWFFEKRISKDLKKYRKWKIKQTENDSSSI